MYIREAKLLFPTHDLYRMGYRYRMVMRGYGLCECVTGIHFGANKVAPVMLKCG